MDNILQINLNYEFKLISICIKHLTLPLFSFLRFIFFSFDFKYLCHFQQRYILISLN